VLKYIARARSRGLGVVLITHNPHHAYPVGDHFVLLRRGQSLGEYTKRDMTLGELTTMMAGGAELEELSDELTDELSQELDRELDGDPGPSDFSARE
jgi:simple sugar transport system ATP-binding protein